MPLKFGLAEKFNMNLAPILRKIGMTQKELAQELGVREEAVSRWVNGHHHPGGRNLLTILAVLQGRDSSITIEDLSDEEPRAAAAGE